MAMVGKIGKSYYKVRVGLGVVYPSEKPQRRKQRFIREAFGEYIGSLTFGRNVPDRTQRLINNLGQPIKIHPMRSCDVPHGAALPIDSNLYGRLVICIYDKGLIGSSPRSPRRALLVPRIQYIPDVKHRNAFVCESEAHGHNFCFAG